MSNVSQLYNSGNTQAGIYGVMSSHLDKTKNQACLSDPFVSQNNNFKFYWRFVHIQCGVMWKVGRKQKLA